YSQLERQLGRKLKLPRIEHGSRRSKILVRPRRNKKLRRNGHSRRRREGWTGRLAPLDRDGGRVFIASRNSPADNRRAVDAEHFINVGPVEKVERVESQIEPDSLADLEEAGEAQIPGAQRVADVGISCDQPDTIGHGIGIAVGVASDEECEGAPCLDGDDAAQLEVPQKTLLGAGRAEVCHKAVADILIRIGPFSYIVELVLREVDES